MNQLRLLGPIAIQLFNMSQITKIGRFKSIQYRDINKTRSFTVDSELCQKKDLRANLRSANNYNLPFVSIKQLWEKFNAKFVTKFQKGRIRDQS